MLIYSWLRIKSQQLPQNQQEAGVSAFILKGYRNWKISTAMFSCLSPAETFQLKILKFQKRRHKKKTPRRRMRTRRRSLTDDPTPAEETGSTWISHVTSKTSNPRVSGLHSRPMSEDQSQLRKTQFTIQSEQEDRQEGMIRCVLSVCVCVCYLCVRGCRCVCLLLGSKVASLK